MKEEIMKSLAKDVVNDHFIASPKKAREVDASKYKMTKMMYEYGISWFESSENFKEDFEENYEVSWERGLNEWSDQYVSGIWKPRDWAFYMLDQLSDAISERLPYKKFPILESI